MTEWIEIGDARLACGDCYSRFPNVASVFCQMFLAIKRYQIIERIIQSIAIFVMNQFAFGKRAMLFFPNHRSPHPPRTRLAGFYPHPIPTVFVSANCGCSNWQTLMGNIAREKLCRWGKM